MNPKSPQLGHPLLRVVGSHGHAEQPVIRVLADADQGTDQDIQCLGGQVAHLAERSLLQPWPVAHAPG